MQSLFLEKQIELGPDDVGADVRRDAESAAERIEVRARPAEIGVQIHDAGRPVGCEHPRKARAKSGVGSLDPKNES
jgi:hypothetical protein